MCVREGREVVRWVEDALVSVVSVASVVSVVSVVLFCCVMFMVSLMWA